MKYIRIEHTARTVDGDIYTVYRRKPRAYIATIEWNHENKEFTLRAVAHGAIFSAETLRDIAGFLEEQNKT